jgi:predicted MFS family arabinose efflux permease
MNSARAPGQVLIGYLSDQVGPGTMMILTMAIVSSVSIYLIWGPAANKTVLLIFSLCFGAFAERSIPSFDVRDPRLKPDRSVRNPFQSQLYRSVSAVYQHCFR